MPILIRCPSGHKLSVKSELAGKTLKCPKCQLPVAVPIIPAEQTSPVFAPVKPAAKVTTMPPKPAVAKSPPAPPKAVLKPPVPPPVPKVIDEMPADDDWDLGLNEDHSDESFGDDAEFDNEADDSEYELQPLPRKKVKKRSSASDPTPQSVEKSSAKRALPLWMPIVAGSVVGVMLLSGLAWMLFGRSEKPPVANAAIQPVAAQPVGATTPEQPTVPVVASPVAVQPQPTAAIPSPQPVPQPAEPPEPPTNLARFGADERLKAFQTPGPVWASAYDSVTGLLAISNDKESGVMLYDVDDLLAGKREVKKILKTDGVPTAMCIKPWQKQRLLVIAGSESPTLQFFDTETLEASGRIPLTDDHHVSYLASSANPDDPNLYFSLSKSEFRSDVRTRQLISSGRVDLANRSFSIWKDNVAGKFHDVAVSSLGDLLYLRGESPHPLVVAACRNQANGDTVVAAVHQEMGEPGEFTVSPLADVVATRRTIYLPQMQRSIKRVDYEPKAFFRDRPIVLGLKQRALVLASGNDYDVRLEIPLSESWFPKRTDSEQKSPWDYRYRKNLCRDFEATYVAAAADDSRQLAVVVAHRHVALLPCEKLNMRVGEFLKLTKPLPTELPVEATFEQTLDAGTDELVGEILPADDNLAPTEIAEGLQKIFKERAEELSKQGGVRQFGRLSGLPVETEPSDDPADRPVIDGRTIRWTPKRGQIGTRFWKLRLRSGKDVRETLWEVRIAQPSLAFSFQAQGVAFNSDGQRAIVWGQSAGDPPADPSQLKEPIKPTAHLALVDVTTRNILTQREITEPIAQAVVDGSGVFGIRRDKNTTKIISFHPETLESREETSVPILCVDLRLIANRYLALRGKSNDVMLALNVADLKPVPKVAGSWSAGQQPDGWVWNGVLWDQALEKPRLLLHPPFASDEGLSLRKAGDGFIRRHWQGCQLMSWTSHAVIVPEFGQTGSLDFPGLVTLEGASVSVETAMKGGGPRGQSSAVVMAAVTLVTSEGKVLDQVPLFGPMLPPGDRFATPLVETAIVAAAPGVVAAVVQGKLYFVPKEQFRATQPVPYQMELQQSTFVLSANQPTTVSYAAERLKRMTLELRTTPDSEKPDLKETSQDGVFRLDLKPILKSFEGATQRLLSRPRRNPDDKKSKDALDNYMDDAKPFFRELTGKAPAGIPVPVYVSVIAEQDDGQKAGIAHCYLVELPLSLVQPKKK